MGKLDGRVALVTGATSGIGRATAARLAAEGARVAVAGRDEARGRETVEAIARQDGTAWFAALDVTDEAVWQATIAGIVDTQGRFDILVNNAGTTQPGEIETLALTEWRRIMAVNADGVFLGTKHAIPAMRASGGGAIVNIASVLGITSYGTLSAYTASKAAVRYFTKCAALECARNGSAVRVNSVHPAFIHTPMMEQTALDMYGDIETGKAEFGKLHPIGHVGTPEDVAGAVAYLASDEARFVTGAELVVDGGFTLE